MSRSELISAECLWDHNAGVFLLSSRAFQIGDFLLFYIPKNNKIFFNNETSTTKLLESCLQTATKDFVTEFTAAWILAFIMRFLRRDLKLMKLQFPIQFNCSPVYRTVGDALLVAFLKQPFLRLLHQFSFISFDTCNTSGTFLKISNTLHSVSIKEDIILQFLKNYPKTSSVRLLSVKSSDW